MSCKMSADWKRGFTDGYICAVATLVRQHDETGMAADLLRELGRVDLRKVDAFDRPMIRKVIREVGKL
jgi:hypothetical protein